MLRYFLRRLHIFRHRAQTFHAVNNKIERLSDKTVVSSDLQNITIIKSGKSLTANNGTTLYRTIVYGSHSLTAFLTTDKAELYIGYVLNAYPTSPALPIPLSGLLITQDQSITQECVLYLKNDGGIYLSVPQQLKSDKFNTIMISTIIWGNYNR